MELFPKRTAITVIRWCWRPIARYWRGTITSNRSTPLFETLEILGPDLCRTRLREALEALGGLSKKQAEQLERDYRSLAGPREAEST